MSERVPVVEKILGANERLAAGNQARLEAAGVYGLNFMASPGAGKTSVIERTIAGLEGELQLAVIDGDVATSIECHLDAVMLQDALAQLDLEAVDLLIVENVGNLICPANFQLGTHKSVLIASIPEGDDKPYKYPGMYRGVDALIINKTDLLPYIDFDMDYFRRGVEALNPGLVTFPLSCRTGEGLEAWLNWIREEVNSG